LRAAAGLHAGAEVEVALHNGRIEIEPVTVPASVVGRGAKAVIELESDDEPLTTEQIRAVLESLRR
jgi:hypothetical protein